MSQFVHLHVHSEYSLLDGISKLKPLVKKAKELGMPALGITDHGSMYGAVEFYKLCKENEIKPIIGCEMYVAPRSHDLKTGKIYADPYHLTVLAKNYQGYLNLMKLVSIAWLDGYYYKPRVDKELLKKYSEGLIALSACPGGEFIRSLQEGGVEAAENIAKTYLEIFGEGNYYFEVQNHHYKEFKQKPGIDPVIFADLEKMEKLQDLTWKTIKELSPKLGIPIVATNDLHYINKEDAEAHDAVLCVQTGKFVHEINRLRLIDTPDLYLKSPEEMVNDFPDMPEALENTVKIAEMCDLEIPMGVAHFPNFEIPEGKTAIEYLREETFSRAQDRMEMDEERKERLDYELSVIEKKGYATYFLIVADFMNWATSQGILTNTRGSAAGSLVLYAMGITDVDPIFYKLPFERFLNPFRPSLPDIDADMADDRRDDIIRYVMQKYGEEKVAHIVTFGTMMGRAAIRDIGRVLAIPYGEVDRIAKFVPPPHQGFHKPLKDALVEIPELKTIYETNRLDGQSNGDYRKMLDLAQRIEGTVRHASVHAAGIVIGPKPLDEFAPLQREANGDKKVIQYDFHMAEEIGLVKMDFLGIRNLSILGRAVEYVKKNRGIDVDIHHLPLDDPKAFELLGRGETMGLFQLESDGMTKNLMELKPTTIFDISAMVALYRPGPLSIIPEYVARKHHPEKITYFDPRMEAYLERSLGLLVYQDDVLLTAINIAGYNWEDADKFRKAMGKKIPEEMALQKEKFLKGAVENGAEYGMTEERAKELFKLIEPFAAYGFNKAHAASYGLVAYQTAYMKGNFPVEFMAAVMTAEYGNTEKIAHAIEECKRMGIVVLPPDVNYSHVGFTIENLADLSDEERARQLTDPERTKEATQGIRFGLSAIKNVGIPAIESIIKAREEGGSPAGEFKDLSDLCHRVETRLVNRKCLESLIKSGAMDTLGKRAAQLLTLDECLESAHKINKSKATGQYSLFGDDETEAIRPTFNLPEVDEYTLEEMLVFERDLLGFYLHEPTFMKKLKNIDQYVSVKLAAISHEDVGRKVTLGGVITDVRKIYTKKTGAEMAFIKIFDGTRELDAVVFPKTFEECKECLVKEQVVLIDAKIENREDEFSLITDKIQVFDEDSSTKLNMTEVEIEIPENADGDLLKKLNSTLRLHPGVSPISVLIPKGRTFKRMKLQFTVDPNFQLVENVEEILGKNSIRLI